MKGKERLVIHGNEFYVIDLDCLEKKEKNMTEYTGKDEASMSGNLLSRKRKGIHKKDNN